MPSGGHNAKTAEEHRIDGSYRRDRHASRGVTAGGDPLRKPDDLDELASEYWDWVVSTRGAFIVRSEWHTLKRLCELYSLSERARVAASKNLGDKNARITFKDYHVEWSKLAADFGLKPNARARQGEAPETKDKSARLLRLVAQ